MDNISVEKKFDGALVVAAMVDGHRVARRYYGYSEENAKELFSFEVKSLKRGA